MSVMNVLTRFLPALVLPVSLAGCVLEDAPPRRLSGESSSGSSGYVAPPPSSGSSSGGSSSSSSGGTAIAPMLVVVDTDQTLTAAPGEGVGVFIEYAAGGHWTIWWTCDTNITGQSCNMLVDASIESGDITAVTPTGLDNGGLDTSDPARLRASTSVSTTLQGVTFTTAPGAVLTVEASVGGLKDAAFLFFVQDGKVNGGAQSKLTNPLKLQGSTP